MPASWRQQYFRTEWAWNYLREEDAADDDKLHKDDAELGIEDFAHLNYEFRSINESIITIDFKQFGEIFLAVFEDGGCHQVHLLLFEDVNHLHLLLDGQEEIIQLLLIPLRTVRNLFSLLAALLHRPHLQIIQVLG